MAKLIRGRQPKQDATAQLQAELAALREKLAQQEAELSQQKALVAQLAETKTAEVERASAASPKTSRRRLLRKLAVGAAAAAAATTALGLENNQAQAVTGSVSNLSGFYAFPQSSGSPTNLPPIPHGVAGSDNSDFGSTALATTISGVLPPSVIPGGVGTYGYSNASFGLGVAGFASNATAAVGVGGLANGAGSFGVVGGATGLAGTGVSGVATGLNGTGVNGQGGKYGASFTGTLAPLFLQPGLASGAPTSNNHQLGELYVDSAGNLYLCTTPGTASTPGTFTRLNSPSGTTVYLKTPLRILGSPNSNYPTAGSGENLPANTVKYYKIEGTFTNNPPPPYSSFSDTIPNTAKAIIGTLVIFNATTTGFITVYPGDAASPPAIATATYQGGAGIYTSAAFNSKLGVLPSAAGADAGKLGIAINAFTACSITLDVVGYVL